jgi:hypothetical protein
VSSSGWVENVFRTMVHRRHRLLRVAVPGRVDAQQVAQHADDPRLVVGAPALHAIAERAPADLGVLREALGGVARQPAAVLLQPLWQVPVVELHQRLDAVRLELVEKAPVEVDAALLHGARPGRLDARPGE